MKRLRKINIKALFSLVMVWVICSVTMGSVPAISYTAYIDPELKSLLETANSTDLIPVDVWLYETDTEDIEEAALQTAVNGDVSVLSINSEELTAENLTNEQINAYIETERELYATTQVEASQAFLNKYSNMFTTAYSLNSDITSKVTFISKYAPSIQMELTPEQINRLSKDLSVESIYHLPKPENSNSSDISVPVTGASYVRDTLGLTGSGIKIGILEAEGLPERGSYNIPKNKIVFDPNVDKTVFSPHATQVAAIIMGQDDGTYEGIVPDAYVYATYTSDNVSWRQCAEWLISRGVNIINMSMRVTSNAGAYNSEDRWADHIAMHHNVHLIVSAGNYKGENYYVKSPGLAHNVVTVGNLDTKGTNALSDDVIASDSCYLENSSTKNPHKPDLVAPGENIQTAVGIWSGTSFAAPHITGIVAQLCQANSQLKTQQNAMKAILTATAVTDKHSYVPGDSEYDKYGAGLVSAINAYKSVISGSSLITSFAANTDFGRTGEHTFTIDSAKNRFRISLTWLNYSYIPEDDHVTNDPDNESYYMADLDLFIYDANRNLVGYCSKEKGNVEIVDLYNLPAGTYTMEVRVVSGSPREIYYSLAWWHNEL